jgi:hypothetical protein
MSSIDRIRNGIIDKLLTISNKDYLSALYQLVETGSPQNETVKLSEEQILMLKLSDRDIESGKLIKQSELDKSDLQYLLQNNY